jgi:hypothetical protein
MSYTRNPFRTVLGTISALTLAACGHDATAPRESTQVSAAEARSVATALFEEVAQALSNVTFMRARHALPAMHLGALPAAAASLPTSPINAPCPGGGRIVGTLELNDNTDDDATGQVTGSITIAPQGCVVHAGGKAIAVDGDPSLNYTFRASFLEGYPSSDFVWRASGGIKWTGNSCRVDYTVTISPDDTATIRGTVCGQSVDGTF